MRDAKLLPNLAQIARDSALVLHHARAADHLQVRDPGEVSKNFVLHAIGKAGALLVGGEVFEWENCYAFLWNHRDKGGCVPRQSVGYSSRRAHVDKQAR